MITMCNGTRKRSMASSPFAESGNHKGLSNKSGLKLGPVWLIWLGVFLKSEGYPVRFPVGK